MGEDRPKNPQIARGDRRPLDDGTLFELEDFRLPRAIEPNPEPRPGLLLRHLPSVRLRHRRIRHRSRIAVAHTDEMVLGRRGNQLHLHPLSGSPLLGERKEGLFPASPPHQCTRGRFVVVEGGSIGGRQIGRRSLRRRLIVHPSPPLLRRPSLPRRRNPRI